MLNLDARTLLLVEAFVLFLVGGLMLLAGLQGRRDRPLIWMSAALLMGGVGFLLSLARSEPRWWAWAITGANMLLITGHACVWAGLRVFAEKRVRGPVLLAGAAVWFALCQWPWFMTADKVRMLCFSLIAIAYLVAAGREIWPERREDIGSVMPLLVILAGHGLFYSYRMAIHQVVPDASWLHWSDFTLTMLEGILFAISLSFGVLILVRGQAERRYRHAALHDALTRLPNRRALFEQGVASLERASREGRDMALLMCDLDWFKRINDEHGHEAGDRVLALFADVLRGRVRAGDLCARIGGEEFVVLVPDLGPLGTLELADRIRRALAGQSPPPIGRLSVSIGIACASADGYDLDRLLACADRALYEAKASGRDCVRRSDGLTASGRPSAPAVRTRATEAGSEARLTASLTES
ncbi:MAG: GGDEF domain-containing protein [Castellaniella sp.]|uniref:GGDEF domain-containing protein n=1 Tax=Castellaniella sp. TaxID=1955812 RepID=UPI003C722885